LVTVLRRVTHQVLRASFNRLTCHDGQLQNVRAAARAHHPEPGIAGAPSTAATVLAFALASACRSQQHALILLGWHRWRRFSWQTSACSEDADASSEITLASGIGARERAPSTGRSTPSGGLTQKADPPRQSDQLYLARKLRGRLQQELKTCQPLHAALLATTVATMRQLSYGMDALKLNATHIRKELRTPMPLPLEEEIRIAKYSRKSVGQLVHVITSTRILGGAAQRAVAWGWRQWISQVAICRTLSPMAEVLELCETASAALSALHAVAEPGCLQCQVAECRCLSVARAKWVEDFEAKAARPTAQELAAEGPTFGAGSDWGAEDIANSQAACIQGPESPVRASSPCSPAESTFSVGPISWQASNQDGPVAWQVTNQDVQQQEPSRPGASRSQAQTPLSSACQNVAVSSLVTRLDHALQKQKRVALRIWERHNRSAAVMRKSLSQDELASSRARLREAGFNLRNDAGPAAHGIPSASLAQFAPHASASPMLPPRPGSAGRRRPPVVVEVEAVAAGPAGQGTGAVHPARPPVYAQMQQGHAVSSSSPWQSAASGLHRSAFAATDESLPGNWQSLESAYATGPQWSGQPLHAPHMLVHAGHAWGGSQLPRSPRTGLSDWHDATLVGHSPRMPPVLYSDHPGMEMRSGT